MSGEMAAGDIATGILAGRAVEPVAGEASRDPHGRTCLNCDTRLLGAHCHACGQAGHVHRTIGAIGHEIAHGVFHFEGKIWRTLPMLALRPGELTRRYVAGERARFVSPVAIFLFSVFLLFAVVANLPGWTIMNSDVLQSDLVSGAQETRAKIADERLRAEGEAARRERRVRELRASPEAADRKKLAGAERALAEARELEASIAAAQRYLPPPDRNTDGAASGNGSWYRQKYMAAKKNPKLLIYRIKMSAYKFSWALIPISLPFIWLLFPFRRSVGMYDHAIFATYSLSFMSLLVVALALLGAIGTPSALLAWAAVIIAPLHIYKQLKGGYSLSRAGALWRTAWMLLFTVVASTLFILLLIYLGTVD